MSELNDILRGEVRFVVDAEPRSHAMMFELVVDPNDPALQAGAIAVARRRFSGWTVVGGTDIFDSLRCYFAWEATKTLFKYDL